MKRKLALMLAVVLAAAGNGGVRGSQILTKRKRTHLLKEAVGLRQMERKSAETSCSDCSAVLCQKAMKLPQK